MLNLSLQCFVLQPICFMTGKCSVVYLTILYDLTQAYQQLLLDDESKQLLVVNTPKGSFQFTRLPYGVSTAPAIFQSVMDRILQGLPIACYLDDILIAGNTKEEHDQRLEQVLHRLSQSGIRFREKNVYFSKHKWSI